MVTAASGLAGGEAGLTQLQARLACEDVVRASFRLVDEAAAAQAARLYAADGTLTWSDLTRDVGDTTLRGAEIHRALQQREAEDRRTVHVVTPSSFRLTDPGLGEVECHVQLYVLGADAADRPGPRALSKVHDALIQEADGTWRISARRITLLAGSR